MTFYVGLALGFGVGGCLLFLVVLVLLSVSMRGQSATNKKMFEFWATTVEYQQKHLLCMADIATSLSSPPTLYLADSEEGTDH